MNRRRTTMLLGLLLLGFAVLFVLRGPVRGYQQGADLSHLYAASSLWLSGGNPYDGAQCVEVMRQAGFEKPEHVANGSFYPPPTLAALAPLGLLSWESARVTWLGINLLCCGVLWWVLSSWLSIEDRYRRWLVAGLVMVAWGPITTALSLGQLSLASAACVFAGLLLVNREQRVWAGLLIGLGCLIKPQLGLGFVVLLVLLRDWRALLSAFVLMAVVSGLGIGRVMMTTPTWASDLARNIASDQAPGQVLDASLAGPMRYQMIDLRPLMHLALPGGWVNAMTLLFVALLALLAIVKLMRAGLSQYKLLAVSGVGLLVLLPVYHRYYDAVLLLPLIVLAINTLRRDPYDRLMIGIVLALFALLLPLPAVLAVMAQRGVVPEALHQAWAWQHVVLQVQSWALLFAALALVAWTCRHTPSQA